ncbi:uncharacterized protein LOC117171410 isoform X2 [Belonocnema kinseyi]|uniref:uncharacterized protein LOC117171410 isoform X2 n=1 Tax=Belonocnema kinseyi TaxID=2817044 RepID=UPI00143D4045|nr:uncharacterized protein LOC117171410 isoform X2 [Belonocnema kinseyi]
MGQQTGKMPDTWEELMAEKDRVLQWSSEVLAQINDNIHNEDIFLMDFENAKIDAKVEKWIANNKTRIESTMAKFPDADNDSEDFITNEIPKIKEQIQYKMRKDYQKGYTDLKKFSKRVDNLGNEERKVHKEILQLEDSYKENPKKYQKKFVPLRMKVFSNLRIGEKMLHEENRLKGLSN